MNTRSGLGFAAIAVAALASLSLASSVRADSDGNTRAVIRGTGTDVTIVYLVPKTSPPKVEATLMADPVSEALRRKTSGGDDASIIAFLRLNQADLPNVIDADIVRDFRRAGAGQPLIAVLSTFAAVDIGETAEGAPVQILQPSSDVAYAGSYPDLVGMGYPFYSSYGGAYFGDSFGPRFGRHGKRSGFRSGKPSFPKGHSAKVRPSQTHGRRGASRSHGLR